MEDQYIQKFKTIAVICSVLFLIVFISMYWLEVYSPAWKNYQKEYFEHHNNLTITGADLQKNTLIKQIEIKNINHVDRCITCHMQIEQVFVDSLPAPFSKHSGDLLTDHDIGKFGCTLCHNGVGRSLQRNKTCGDDVFTRNKPLESNCASCHLAVYDKISKQRTMQTVFSGLELLRESGCLGCHKVRGVGGFYGPDLSVEGDKNLYGYDFSNIEGERSIVNWHQEHYREPGRISPGSLMPKFNFNSIQIEALTTLILGFSKPDLPLEYYNIALIKEFKDQRNVIEKKSTYSIFCSGCHGKSGEGRDYRKNLFGVPAVSNPDFQSIASLDMISLIIQEGRSNRNMPSWRGNYSGLHKSELVDLIRDIRYRRAIAPKYAEVRSANWDQTLGEKLYQDHCATCHGKEKNGGIGPSLNSTSFKSLASDQFLYKTLTNGRSNTAMPSWSSLNAISLKSLIRELIPRPNKDQQFLSQSITKPDIKKGEEIFHYKCVRCHGENGRGGIGPAILNRDFLDAAGDYFIYQTIRQGRNHTPMFSQKEDVSEIRNVVAFMRTKENYIDPYIVSAPSLGDPEKGKKLFQRYCVECHGHMGEGIKAPALNNQEFLNAATNGYLLARITIGVRETPMPAWGKSTETRRALNARERHHLSTYIRQWQTLSIRRDPDDPIYEILSGSPLK